MRSGLNELVGNKAQLRTDFALTLLPRLRIKSQAIEERRTSSLHHSAPLSIDRAGDSLDFSLILYLVFQARKQGSCSLRWSIRILNCVSCCFQPYPLRIRPFSTLSISLEMDRQFPPEIIQLIVRASLDPYEPFGAGRSLFNPHYRLQPRQRYRIFKSYSLLNSTWRVVSDQWLYEWVCIDSKASAANFLEVAEARGRTIEGVKYLRIISRFDAGLDCSRLLRSAPQIVGLYVFGVDIDIDDLAPLQQLHQLEMSKATVDGPPTSSPLCLPSLRRATLWECRIEPGASHLLTNSSLPTLRHLQLYETATPARIDSLLPQLEAISLCPLFDHSFSDASSMLLVQLPFFDYETPLLSHLPNLPPFLFIPSEDDQFTWDVGVADTLQEIAETGKQGLRVILLSIPEMGMDEQVREVIETLAIRGVRVENEEGMSFSRAIEKMERILEEEKRTEERRAEDIRRRRLQV